MDNNSNNNSNLISRRLEALDLIEVKLQKMKELACYAANRSLNETEALEVQEWINILYEEVNALDRMTSLGNYVLEIDGVKN